MVALDSGPCLMNLKLNVGTFSTMDSHWPASPVSIAPQDMASMTLTDYMLSMQSNERMDLNFLDFVDANLT